MTRKKRTVTLPEDVLGWIEKQMKIRRFSSVSHALEFCVYQVMQKEKTKLDKQKSNTKSYYELIFD